MGLFLEPPIIQDGDARILLDQDAATAVVRGLKQAKPELFIYGSFDVPDHPDKPIEIPLPHTGAMYLNYRIELANPTFDFAPTDKVMENFPNPFILKDNGLAVFTTIMLSMASHPPGSWREDIPIHVWIKCELLPLVDGFLKIKPSEVRVRIPDATNSSLVRAFEHTLNEYLNQSAQQIAFPIPGILQGGIFTVTIAASTIHFDALDATAMVS